MENNKLESMNTLNCLNTSMKALQGMRGHKSKCTSQERRMDYFHSVSDYEVSI